ncbi:MAG: DUF6390 family protein [Patescibacteria group bacterium]
MNKKALQLACRFSLPPNSLGYCGQNSAAEKFKKCVIESVCNNVKEELSKFIVLNPYFETLAQITKSDKFSYEVVEAYWLGNTGLKKSKTEHYNTLLNNFIKQGVPTWFVDELRTKTPKVFIPHHLFQVLHVGVGKASGSVPFNLESINNCMIRWGEVIKIKNNELVANLYSLKKSGKNYKLTQKNGQAKFIDGFLPKLKLGDVVAVHWGQAVKVLTLKEVNQLSFWTQEVLSHVN